MRDQNSADSNIEQHELLARLAAFRRSTESLPAPDFVCEGRALELSAQLDQGAVKDLTYASLGQREGFADLFQCQTLVKVEGRDETFPLLELAYSIDELGAQVFEVRVELRIDGRRILEERSYSIPGLPSTSNLVSREATCAREYWSRKSWYASTSRPASPAISASVGGRLRSWVSLSVAASIS